MKCGRSRRSDAPAPPVRPVARLPPRRRGPAGRDPISLAPEGLSEGWNEFTPGGDTGCSRGDPFACWGNNRTWYGQGQNAFPIDHVGAVNTQAVFRWVFANFREPEQVLVTGCSAGSYGSALWSAHVMDHWPEADVVQFGDRGAGIITEQFFADSFPSWNAEPAFPAWIDSLDPAQVSLLDKSLSDLYVGVADAYPNHEMSQFNTRLDSTQVSYFEFMGGDEAAWSAGMLESVAAIESRASNFCSFTADGEQHCILGAENLYSMEADGVRVVDWLQGLLDGADVGSVSCLDCQ